MLARYTSLYYNPTLQGCINAVHSMSAGQYVNEDKLVALCQLTDGGHTQLYTLAQTQLNPMRNDPVVAQLTLNDTPAKGGASLEQLFLEAEVSKTPEVREIASPSFN